MSQNVHDKLRNGKIPVGNLHLSRKAFVETVNKSEHRLTKGLVRKNAKILLRGEVQALPRLRTTSEPVVITNHCIL